MDLRRTRKALLTAIAGVLAAAVVVFVYAQVAFSSDYLLLPDDPHALSPLVKVEGGHQDAKGGIYFVDIIQRQATIAERYLPFLRDEGASIVPREDVVIDNVSERVQNQIDLASMKRSQKIAEALALKSLGYHVVVKPKGALVEQLAAGFPAEKKLLPGDVIVAVDGKPVRVFSRLTELMTGYEVGRIVRLTILRGGKERRLSLRTAASPADPDRALIGVRISQAASIDLPIKVAIDPGNVGGPSAGLAFALELYQKLGPDIDRGYRIAATGEIELDGTIEAIGGVEQKVIGARRGEIQVMLVPAGDNARTARRYAGGMKIIAVTSFQQALHALATLPPKR